MKICGLIGVLLVLLVSSTLNYPLVWGATTTCGVTTDSTGLSWKIHVKNIDGLICVQISLFDDTGWVKSAFSWKAPPQKTEVTSDWLPKLLRSDQYYRVAAEDVMKDWQLFKVNTDMSVEPITNATGVGGIAIPVDKFGLLAPYIGLTSTTIVVAVATVVYVKRIKRRKEKQ